MQSHGSSITASPSKGNRRGASCAGPVALRMTFCYEASPLPKELRSLIQMPLNTLATFEASFCASGRLGVCTWSAHRGLLCSDRSLIRCARSPSWSRHAVRSTWTWVGNQWQGEVSKAPVVVVLHPLGFAPHPTCLERVADGASSDVIRGRARE
eukprot:365945-Chlamydomonas_euryale.AAC.3